MTTEKKPQKPLLPELVLRDLPETYYSLIGADYWMRKDDGQFLRLDKGDLKVHLRYCGISKNYYPADANGLTQLEFEIMKIQKANAVRFAGALAGYRIGKYEIGGNIVLVTSEPRPEVFAPPVKKRQFPELDEFLCTLLGADQLRYFLMWLKFARRSLRRGDFMPGQFLGFAGPSGCGKSLLQALITEFLGGRSARPYRYMTGETPFNSDLAGAEHLIIEDENADTRITARRKFGSSIKEFTVVAKMSVHPKGKEAIELPTFKRGSCSFNDEPENVAIMPPMDESILDKVMLFKCARATVPSEDRLENWKTLTAQLPFLDAWLNDYQCPKEMADSRYGVRAYHNPELLELLVAISPESRLLNLIDQVIDFKTGPWTGTSEEIEEILRKSNFGLVVEKMFYYASACGTYLGRLAQKNPNRVECRKANGKTRWIIRQPPISKED